MKQAIVIGINDYPRNSLKGCINDATELAKLLKENEDGTPNFCVDLMMNIESMAKLRKSIRDLFSYDCDTSLLYFAGHGFINEIGGYIVTPDATRYDEGVSMYEILTLANQSKQKNRIIIFDCCHSGFMGNSGMKNNAECHITGGVTILTSCKEDEEALEVDEAGKYHGVFSNLLLEALRGGAADIQGHVSPGSIYAYIDKALRSLAQRPIFKTNVSRFISLRNVKPQIPLKTLEELIRLFPKSNDIFSLDPSFEDTNSPSITHELVEPYAVEENVRIFKILQKMQSVGLVVPVDSDFMYFAAMKSRSCRLTPLGQHYWHVVRNLQIHETSGK